MRAAWQPGAPHSGGLHIDARVEHRMHRAAWHEAEARFCEFFAARAYALLNDFMGRKQREALAALTRTG
jgi:hypothetical protein